MMANSVVTYLKPGNIGICEVQNLLRDDFTLTVMSKDLFDQHGAVYNTLAEVCNTHPPEANFRPQFGDLVAAESETYGWQRGHVLSLINGIYRVAMFDIGLSEKIITNVKRLSTEFLNIPEFGVRARVEEYHIDQEHFRNTFLKLDMSFSFEVLQCVSDACTVNLLCKDSKTLLCRVSISPWVPKFEDRGLHCLTLKSGDHVDVLSYASSNGMYVRPMDEVQDKLWQSVIQHVGAHCFTEKVLSRMPDIGELVACRFSGDNRYYRAVVVDFDDEKILVSYVDFGNTEHVTIGHLKPLSQRLKEVPCTAVLVKLKAVAQRPLTKSAVMFLNGLVAGTGLLTVLFDKSYSKEGVELRMADKRAVSDELNARLTPSWKTALAEGKNPAYTVFYGENVESMTFPKEKLFKLTVTFVESANTFWGCPYGSDIAHYILNKMPEELAEFCNAISSTRYVPRQNELCIAKCNDVWCRAICRRTVNSFSELHFIDYGDTLYVDHSRIRKMVIDFVWHKSVAILCSVDGLPENLTDDMTARLKDLICVNSVHEVRVNSIENEFQYHLQMPDVLQALSAGLLADASKDTGNAD